MTQQFNSVRDIIDDYEWFWKPIIKRELAECKNEEDYVYGKLLKCKDKQISRNGLYEKDFDAKEEALSNQDYFDMTSADYDTIYKILHSDKDITFTSPNPHQKRWYNRLGNIIKELQKLNIQEYRFTNFEHLYDVVRTIFVLNAHPNAFLTIYDTALRIGYNHAEPIFPSKFVYLYGGIDKNHKPRGPLGGAIALYGAKWVDEHIDKDYPHRIETRWSHEKFPNLPSWEIESILCIYADRFTYNMPY